MTVVKSRGNSWVDGPGEVSNDIGWGVTISTAIGVESGLEYTVKWRRVSVQGLDPEPYDEWPADWFAGS